ERGSLDDLRVTFMGDLRHGRTVKSLSKLLRHFGARQNFVAPEALQMPVEGRQAGDGVAAHLDGGLTETDGLYVTRVQKERLPEDLRGRSFEYVVDEAVMARAPERLVLMHPLPRVGEIARGVDGDPRAAYFQQMRYGLYVRMALLREMLL